MARGCPASLREWKRFAMLGLLEPGLGFALADYGLAWPRSRFSPQI